MIVQVAGTNKKGRVVMPSAAKGYWVLNMGGPHGTPKVVHEDNIITRGNPGIQWWRDRSVESYGLLRKCLALHKGEKSGRLQELAERMQSKLGRLGEIEEAFEKHYRPSRNPGLTIKQVKQQMPTGYVLSKDQAGDYIVKKRGAPESQWYFTDDLQDALGTAMEMERREEQQSRSRLAKRSTNPHGERSRMASPSLAVARRST
jgi:hypothetical protein